MWKVQTTNSYQRPQASVDSQRRKQQHPFKNNARLIIFDITVSHIPETSDVAFPDRVCKLHEARPHVSAHHLLGAGAK